LQLQLFTPATARVSSTRSQPRSTRGPRRRVVAALLRP
jgi:hypothetical protein